MNTFDWLNSNAAVICLIATLSLVIIIVLYIFITKRTLDQTIKQSNLIYNPVIAINIYDILISSVFEKSRRNMSVSLGLTNIGNAPAIQVLIDAEITFKYSSINSEKTIPARFEPDVISYIRPNEEIKDGIKCSPNFGNRCINSIFDDFRECKRLNIQRIENDPIVEPFNATALKIIIYYQNSIGQYFKSIYETYLLLGVSPKIQFPKDNEVAVLTQIYVPRPRFNVCSISSKKMEKEIRSRNKKRDLCGY